jgi:hypothetical protein
VVNGKNVAYPDAKAISLIARLLPMSYWKLIALRAARKKASCNIILSAADDDETKYSYEALLSPLIIKTQDKFR